jgi:ubiquinone/menaquinone biosynthesis C-methylase UbiE
MAEMSWQERVLCGSAPWGWFARTVVLPWALQGEELNGDVLEIGSGSGAVAAALLERFPDARLTATDYDPRLVETLRQRLAPFGARARAEQADAAALPFADGSFDAVLSFLMLHHVGRWEDALREAVRVLRQGGTLLAYDLVASPLTRGVHRLGGDRGERPIEWPRLAPLVESLALEDIRPRRSGLVFRLKARRSLV